MPRSSWIDARCSGSLRHPDRGDRHRFRPSVLTPARGSTPDAPASAEAGPATPVEAHPSSRWRPQLACGRKEAEIAPTIRLHADPLAAPKDGELILELRESDLGHIEQLPDAGDHPTPRALRCATGSVPVR